MGIDAGTVGTVLGRVALATAVATAALGLLRRPRAARSALRLSAAAAAGATVALGWALVHLDPALAEVAGVSTRTRPWYERVAGLWGASRPSLLLWAAMLAMALARAAPAVRRVPAADDGIDDDGIDDDRRNNAASAAASVVSGILLAALLAVVVLVADPFHRLAVPALDGSGLTPILRHAAMLVHPPLLYVAQVLAVALAVRTAADVAVRDALPPTWPAWARRWALVTGAVTAAALAIGAWWAYAELGWGGFWAWDPVENAGLLPWLTTIALVHALRAGAVRVAAALAAWGGVLALSGATLTRSGVGISVHAFTPNTAVGRSLTALVAAAAVAALVLTWRLWRTRPGVAVPDRTAPSAVTSSGWRTRAPHTLVLPAAVALFGAVTVVVAVGTAVPLARPDRLIRGTYFARMTAPLSLVTLVGVGLGPPLVRRRSIPARWMATAIAVGFAVAVPVAVVTRSPYAAVVAALTPATLLGLALATRDRPALLAHAGAVALLLGVAGSTAGADRSAWLHPGEVADVQGWTVGLVSVRALRAEDRDRVVADLAVRGQGRRLSLHPSADRWDGWSEPLAETASTTGTAGTTVQVVLRRVVTVPDPAPESGATPVALLDIHVRPLLPLVWTGAALLTAGTLAAGRPGTARGTRPRRRAATQREDGSSTI